MSASPQIERQRSKSRLDAKPHTYVAGARTGLGTCMTENAMAAIPAASPRLFRLSRSGR